MTSDDDFSKDRSTIMAHYYRAMVGRADMWRTRMDTTTNWAIGSSAAILSFTLSDENIPHYVVSIAPLMTVCFLLLESRRLTFYNLFQQRVLLLENSLIRRAAGLGERRPNDEPAAELDSKSLSESELSRALDTHLGRTHPTMPLGKAMARRLRRVYLYVFGIQLLAWGFKLAGTPGPVQAIDELVSRAHVGVVPGGVVWAAVLLLSLGAVGTAVVRGGVDRDGA